MKSAPIAAEVDTSRAPRARPTPRPGTGWPAPSWSTARRPRPSWPGVSVSPRPAIRRHLDVLLAGGHLEAREQRVYGARGRGRPAKVVRADRRRPGRLLHRVRRPGHPGAGLTSPSRPARMRSPGSPSSGSPPSRSATASGWRRPTPDTTPAEALAAALTEDGYVASTLPSALGEQLCQHHCPVAHVAEQFPQLCEVETQTFSRLLGVHVQRLATIAHGDGVCTTHIPPTEP